MDIFIKKDEVHESETVRNGPIDYKKMVETTIPTNARKTPDKKALESGLKEWRWRVLKFSEDERKVEMSYFDPKDKKRYFLNNKGIWVMREVSTRYDDLVVEEYYYYPDNWTILLGSRRPQVLPRRTTKNSSNQPFLSL